MIEVSPHLWPKEVPTKKFFQESAGRSQKGGRPDKPDADSLYSHSMNKGFLFADLPGTGTKNALLAHALNGLTIKDAEVVAETLSFHDEKDIRAVHLSLQEYVKVGKLGGIDILCDGVGTDREGEVASSIATFMFARHIQKAIENNTTITDEVIKEAVYKAHFTVRAYNEKNQNNPPGRKKACTTLVAQITDSSGKTYVASVGDSRAYRIHEHRGLRITHDQNILEAAIVLGSKSFSDSFKNKDDVPNSLRAYIGQDEELLRDSIKVLPLDLLPDELLVLCCDGVWQGLELQSLKGPMEDMDKHLAQTTGRYARQQALDVAYGELFRTVNLAGISQESDVEALTEHLTSEEVGKHSGDNVSAVVVRQRKLTKTLGDSVKVKRRTKDAIEDDWHMGGFDSNGDIVVWKGSVMKPIPYAEFMALNPK